MLIIMAIHDTVENGRTKYTQQCLLSLYDTVNNSKHRIILVDNNSCVATKKLISAVQKSFTNLTYIKNSENLGTAGAINLGILKRNDGEVVTKTDNDVVWNTKGWADELEETILADPTIGVLGLKRKDIWQHVNHENPAYRTYFDGKLEICSDVMGTCTALNPLLLDKVGFYNQCSPYYGADDVLMACRSIAAGFRNAFLPHIDIDHIDEGGTEYTEWKKREAGIYLGEVSAMCNMYLNGKLDYYYNGGFND